MPDRTAAVTGRVDAVFGEVRVITGSIASLADADTWTPGLRQIFHVDVSCNAATPQSTGWTASAGTITFRMGGTINCTVMVFGF